MTASRRPSWRGWLIAAAVLAAGGGLLLAPATTRQGVDFTVSVHRLPLYLKALSFIDRHCQYRHLARQITEGMPTDREQALALFAWTRQHIQPPPPQLPVVDDHVWHIIVRGYGQADQMADVFTTLATYAGMPAFWRTVKLDGGRLALSFVRVEGGWRMCDVARGLMFTDTDGRWADVEALQERPDLIDQIAGTAAPDGIPYRRYAEAALRPFLVPDVLRARKQMPLPRLAFEVKRALHLIPDHEPWEQGIQLAHAGVAR